MTTETIRQTYSRKDLCELLRCSDVTLWRKVKQGKIRPPREIAGLQRWTDRDVAEIVGDDAEAA